MTIHKRHGLTICTDYDRKPVPIRDWDWTATLDSYDGAPDSCDGFDNYYGPPCANNRVGEGRTEEAAILDLLRELADLDDEELALLAPEQEAFWDGDRS